MLGEEHSARAVVSVAGRELPDDLDAQLSSVVVDARRDQPTLFVLRFTDEHATLVEKSGIAVGAEVRVQVQLAGSGGPAPLVRGDVTSIEADVGPAGRWTTVRGLDAAHRLVDKRRTQTFVQVSASDVARRLAGEAGLRVGRVDAFPERLEHLWQPNVSDWELLGRLAAACGAVVAVRDGALDFCRPENARTAPAASSGARQDAFVVEHGVNLHALRATVTAASQVQDVEVRGWDATAKREVVARVPARTVGVELPSTTPAELQRVSGAPPLVVSSTATVTTAQARERATAIADRVAGGFAEVEATVRGNAELEVGSAVALVGCGAPFDGRYVLSAVRHEISGDEGFLTHLVVAGASDRSTFGVTRSGVGTWAGTGTGAGAGAGVVPAIVTNVKDPDGLGRVKIKFPVVDGSLESWWARVVQVGAGPGRGLFVLPEVGDEVLVVLAEGDLGQPYVLGGLYNGADKPALGQAAHVGASDGKVTRRAFTSRTGMVVELVETPQEERIVLSDRDGKQKLSLVHKPQAAVEILSSGPVNVTADKDVTLSTQTGTVTLKGRAIVLEGTASVEVKAPQVTVDAKSALGLTGTTTTVKGQASVEVSSAGVTQVKGSLVKLN